MLGKFLFSVAVIASAFVFTGSAEAGTTKGVCTVTASVHGGKKFATLKCAKVSEPTNYEIRSTVWEKEDRKRYGNLARFAGRRFTCDLVRGGTTRDNNSTESTSYELKNCK